jgi:8-oxo-dGTP pyrophosphatase MutT (NUDIX family)
MDVMVTHGTGLFREDWLDWHCLISQDHNRSKFKLAMVADRITKTLQVRAPKSLAGNGYKPAAVLIPIQERNDGDYIVLTKRAEQLSHHSGQIAFPGGRVDATDPNELAAALRESHEEIGIDPDHVRILGQLDQVDAAYGFRVTPFVGVIPGEYEFRLNPVETAAVCAVSIASLMEPPNFVFNDYRSPRGHPSYHFYVNGWDVWGVTARIIVQFLELVYDFQVNKS